MVRRLDRVAEFFAADPVRVSACLRLPLIALTILLVSLGEVDHWLPTVYAAVLAGYTAAALVWAVVVVCRPVPHWAGAASTAIDVMAVLALCLVSGGATVALLPLFFLLPISVAFQDRPVLTAIFGIGTAVGYLAVWIVYSRREDSVGLPDVVYTHFGFLLWLAAATTALCYVLTRQAARVAALLDARRRLVSESMQADERHSRELAEQIHDGPLQDLLAARLELDEVRERNPDPALEAVNAALRETAARLRGTVTALHPQILAELGLRAALRELIRQHEKRAVFTIDADLDEVGCPPSQSLLYRAARELLTNAYKHARASTVRIRLKRLADTIVLTIADDGVGFEAATLDRYIVDGHIGLASLQVRLDDMGGSLDLASEPGRGTVATVTAPAVDVQLRAAVQRRM